MSFFAPRCGQTMIASLLALTLCLSRCRTIEFTNERGERTEKLVQASNAKITFTDY